MTANLTKEEIKEMIFQLPVEQIVALMADIEERLVVIINCLNQLFRQELNCLLP